jgi:hypothetical protein
VGSATILTNQTKGNQMARNQKAISVKIATTKVIKALENKLAELNKNWESQEANEAKFQKAMEKWRKEIGKYAIANYAKAENLRTSYRSWNKTLNVDFDLTCDEKDFPTEPQRDFEQLHQHSYREMKEEIENAIRILKMTDEEVVSTSTYNAIARYL